ncbi:UPF0280 family protein [Desulfosarcina sp.]|uniref:UPF0280 family protein n=1 Tax=Desulfosarcina sp. TaxID=2027861 RepID=UPI0029AC7210|nr:UPF0280 family protein [Desulfosarcina sp.]MDX2455222.1 UPF0280 family protein [Desulfosarcina sp.]MDX2492757.1 UPF0280 family protein [Desulfosarcina sp.]
MNNPSDSQPHSPVHYCERTYRQRVCRVGLHAFQVVCQETDLMVQADRLLDDEAREQVLVCRGQIDGYIQRYPNFAVTLAPWREPAFAPEIVREMIRAGSAAGVGPMAAVAGAVAESVGRKLLDYSRHVVVENGGDVFIKAKGPVVAGLFAGRSPLSMKMGINLPDTRDGIGLCTSSGTVGHSLSTGSAEAVSVVSHSCALADAAATAIGNRVRLPRDIKAAIAFGKQIAGVLGVVVVAGREMGAWGQVELVSLKGKKG